MNNAAPTIKKTKDGWTAHKYYAEKGSQTVSKCFVGDKVKYTLWEGTTAIKESDTFEGAKCTPPKTNKDWEELGKVYDIYPAIGESWPKFKGRVQGKINRSQ